ncbi:MAG: hypothetical protein AAGG51_09065 [Cyanobacteria bacterium P01_G01_bin.54]
MKSKQIVGLVLALLGGIGAMYFGKTAYDTYNTNKFWGGFFEVEGMNEYIALTTISGFSTVAGIVMISTDNSKKS